MLARPRWNKCASVSGIARLKPMASDRLVEISSTGTELPARPLRCSEPDAIDAIVAASGGIPRNVNTICFNALHFAFGLDLKRVGSAQVTEALRDLDLHNLDLR